MQPPLQAKTLLSELALTEIPDVRKSATLAIHPALLALCHNCLKHIDALGKEWENQFKDLSGVIVTNLQKCLAGEEEEQENNYRQLLLAEPSGDLTEEESIGQRINTLWTLQEMADREAGHATLISLVQPVALLHPQRLVFLKERRLRYLSESEKPDERERRFKELKNLTNFALRQRYLDICRKRLVGLAQEHVYEPGMPAAYSADAITWEQLSFEWLEIRFDSQGKGEETGDRLAIGLVYRWTQTAFIAAACGMRFLGGAPEAKNTLKDIQTELHLLKESVERGKVAFECSGSREDWVEFQTSWTLLKEALIELQKLIERQKDPSAIKKNATPPGSPTTALMGQPHQAVTRQATLDTRLEAALVAASPRRLLFSPRGGNDPTPRPRAGTGSSTTAPINIPKLKGLTSEATAGSLAAGTLGSPTALMSPNRKESASSPTLASVLQRVDSQKQLYKPSPRSANRFLRDVYDALEQEIAFMQLIETRLRGAVLQSPQAPKRLENKPQATVAIFNQDHPRVTELAGYLRELFQFAEQICLERCEEFDTARPIRFVSDYQEELKKQQEREDRDIAAQLQQLKKEFWQDNQSLNKPQTKEQFLDLWAVKAFNFQRDYAKKKHYSNQETVRLLDDDLETPCPDRALRVLCSHQMAGENAVQLTAAELKAAVIAKSWLGLLKVNLEIGCNRSTPEYLYAENLLSFVKKEEKELKTRIPFLAEQIANDKKKFHFTFPLNQKERHRELGPLKPEELFYLEGSELGDLYTNLQQIRDQLTKYGSFGQQPLPQLPQDKILNRLETIQKLAEGVKIENPEENLIRQEKIWDAYAFSPESEQVMRERLLQKSVRDNLRKCTELVARNAGNLRAVMKVRAQLKQPAKPDGTGKSAKDALRSSGSDIARPKRLSQLFAFVSGADKSPPLEPDKLKRKILKRLAVLIPLLAVPVFMAPLPKIATVSQGQPTKTK